MNRIIPPSKFWAMNKLFTLFIIATFFVSCQEENIKNSYTIKGIIESHGYPFNQEGLIVKLISGDQIIATTTEAVFQFDNLEEGKSYRVIPELDEPSKNGLSTLDMVKIDNYLLGTHPFDAFQKLAADVNMDSQITLDDKEYIRICIVGGECIASWRFVSPDYDGDGNGFVDQYVVTRLISDHKIDFLPLKVGDVNNTINP